MLYLQNYVVYSFNLSRVFFTQSILIGYMKKLRFLFFPTILVLAFGLMLSCAKSSSDDSSSSADTSYSEVTETLSKQSDLLVVDPHLKITFTMEQF